MKKVRISLAQISSRIGNVERNTKQHISILDSLKDERPDFVCFPELSLTGYLMKDVAHEVTRDCKKGIERIAKRTSLGQRVILGFVRQNKLGFIQNAAAVVGDKKLLGTTAKFHLPTYGLFEELRYFTPGNPKEDLKTFSNDGHDFGAIICEDAWHPEPIEALARLGAKIVFCLSSSPVRGVHRTNNQTESPIESQWISLLRAHALMNTIFVAFVNRAGPEDEEFFWGRSTVISPTGEILVRGKAYEPDLITVDIDIEEVRRARRFASFRDHRTKFHELLSEL